MNLNPQLITQQLGNLQLQVIALQSENLALKDENSTLKKQLAVLGEGSAASAKVPASPNAKHPALVNKQIKKEA